MWVLTDDYQIITYTSFCLTRKDYTPKIFSVKVCLPVLFCWAGSSYWIWCKHCSHKSWVITFGRVFCTWRPFQSRGRAGSFSVHPTLSLLGNVKHSLVLKGQTPALNPLPSWEVWIDRSNNAIVSFPPIVHERGVPITTFPKKSCHLILISEACKSNSVGTQLAWGAAIYPAPERGGSAMCGCWASQGGTLNLSRDHGQPVCQAGSSWAMREMLPKSGKHKLLLPIIPLW